MADPVNGAPSLDPAKIAPEVYLLDILIGFSTIVGAQLRFRGQAAIAEKVEALVVMVGPGQGKTLQQYRDQLLTETYGKTASGLLLAGPNDLPTPRA